MAVLTIKNIDSIPFSDFVKGEIRIGLKSLIDAGDLEIVFKGEKDSALELLFTDFKLRSIGCWISGAPMGLSGRVYVNAITSQNYCEDVNDCKTCIPVFRRSQDELGRALAHTALHEIGHVLGLNKKSSYPGANEDGHTGDPTNCMLDYSIHKDYLPFKKDSKHSKQYLVKKDDTLNGIAKRIGFVYPIGTWEDLYNFRGRDGKANRDILRSRNPQIIYPEEEIWVPDIEARINFLRNIESITKSFKKTQIDTMRASIKNLYKPKSKIEF